MAIDLYNGTAYIIRENELMERSEALSFFMRGHMEDALSLYDMDGKYCGLITYKSLLNTSSMREAVIKEKLILEKGNGEAFWERAQRLIQGSADNVLPVFNSEMKLLYFAKYNSKLVSAWNKVFWIQRWIDEDLWKNFKEYKKHFHIVGGMSDVLYYFRKWLCSVGAEVSVEGEAWSFFGIEETVPEDGDVYIVDALEELLQSVDLQYIDLLEDVMHDEVAELKQLLLKPYECDDRRSILFHMTDYAYLAESISPLVFYYLKHGENHCVAIFPSVRLITKLRKGNVRKVIELIKKIESFGGKCYSLQISEVLEQEYDICYLCSQYSGRLPSVKAKYVVGLQTTAIYTHMYGEKGGFAQVFSDKAREEIDYLVASEFIADWVSEKDQKWENKILRFGYPKLDTLYRSLSSSEIPKEWMEKIKGKKVFLSVENFISQEIWDYFFESDDKVLIWRPHPVESIQWEKEKEKRNRMHNVIVDGEMSYYASFQISDALLTEGCTSVTLNYLYMDKPVCIVDRESSSEEFVIDFRQEAWYKSAYIAFNAEDVVEFVEMVSRGEDRKKDELEPYRRRMISHFDGRVCERIYNYFESK